MNKCIIMHMSELMVSSPHNCKFIIFTEMTKIIVSSFCHYFIYSELIAIRKYHGNYAKMLLFYSWIN